MATTNFLIFNEDNSEARTYNDSEYTNATQRQSGVIPGMALSRMHNKMYYQWSSMSKAIADAIVDAGSDCIDNDIQGIKAGLEALIDMRVSAGIANAAGRLSSMPIGTIIDFTGVEPPEGYLVCNGATVAIETYPELYAVIGNVYGVATDTEGNVDSTSFVLPNLMNKFKQGSATAGTVLNAGLPNITGSIGEVLLPQNSGAFRYISRGQRSWASNEGWAMGVPNINASRSSAIYGASTTVQPPALTVLPCIKY